MEEDLMRGPPQLTFLVNPLGGLGYLGGEELEGGGRMSPEGETFASRRNPPLFAAPSHRPPLFAAPTQPHHHRHLLDEADEPLLNGHELFERVEERKIPFCREPAPKSNSSAWAKLVTATSMCLGFMVVELVGGYIAGSLAVMTDAAHLLSDCVGFLVGLFAVWISGLPPTHKFTYGYHRAEVLGALLSIAVVWILTGVFVYLAVERLVKTDFEIHADAMMIVAAIGIFINLLMGCVLHKGHGHSHKETNINVNAATIHVLGDLIQSSGVFLSACIIKFVPSAKLIDPLCTFLCCLLVMLTTLPILRQSIWVLLECLPSHLDYNQIHKALSALEGVDNVHALHIWSLTPGQYVATAHLSIVGSQVNRDELLEKARRVLKETFHLERTTIQVESRLSDVMNQ